MSRPEGIVRWEDPPPYAADRRVSFPQPWFPWSVIASQLRSHPKRWAWAITAPNESVARVYASRIRRGRMPYFTPDGSFEAIAVEVDTEQRVYACYLGEEAQ